MPHDILLNVLKFRRNKFRVYLSLDLGGGAYAYTILGVIFNEDSGDVRFLILDPHYTGKDELKTVTSKGWCSWKGPEFWDDKVFYNMCMPQRPVCI